MNTITYWLDIHVAEAIGWTLLHSLWQGAAIAFTLAIFFFLARQLSARFRYWASVAAMAVLVLASIGTFALLYEPSSQINEASLLSAQGGSLVNDAQESLSNNKLPVFAEDAADYPTVFLLYFEQHLPLLVSLWLLGVFLLGLRLLGEVAYIQHLKNYRCRKPDQHWLEKLRQIARAMGIRKEVSLLETKRIHSPMVVGVFKQVILLPVGLLSGLPPEQVEAVLAHELAHVRRYDYLANLLLSLAELLFFFNPMMWWISKKAKAERENACDDLAIRYSGDALALVRSLAQLEERRQSRNTLALAFTGKEGSVLARIQRILNKGGQPREGGRAFWAFSIVAVCLALLAFQSSTPTAATEDIEEAPALQEERIVNPAAYAAEGSTSAELAEVEPQADESAAPAGIAVQPPERLELIPFTADTVPDDARRAELEMRKLAQEMHEMEMIVRRKEQELRRKELQLRKEAQATLQQKQKAIMELSMQIRSKEYEREMLESEYEMKEHQFEVEELALEDKSHELHLLEEAAHEAEGKDAQEKLRAYQTAQRQLLEQKKATEMRLFQVQKEQQQKTFQKEQEIRALEGQAFQLEQELEMAEKELEFKMMALHHEMEQIEAELRIKEQELRARAEEMERQLNENGGSQ